MSEENTTAATPATEAAATPATEAAIFDNQEGSLEENAEAATATASTTDATNQGDGGEILISDPDNADKVDTLTGGDLEMSEEDIISAMTVGDEIRNSQTVPSGKYIISMEEIRLAKDVKFVFTSDANGNPKPVREKNIGMRYKIHYNLDNKTQLEDNAYQMYHLAKKDGSPFAGGRTDYKRMCANAIAAAFNDPDKSMEAILAYLDKNSLAPAVAFNEYAASTEDSKHYFIANIKENPPAGDFPASNELVIGTLKDDGGYYASLTATS